MGNNSFSNDSFSKVELTEALEDAGFLIEDGGAWRLRALTPLVEWAGFLCRCHVEGQWFGWMGKIGEGRPMGRLLALIEGQVLCEGGWIA